MSIDVTNLAKQAIIGQLEQMRDQVHTLSEPLSEAEFWTKPLEPGNSVGHLVLHLTGNLSHFVGAQLGGTGYMRDREREFTEAQPPDKAESLTRLDAAVATFRHVVEELSPEQLAAPHPETRFGLVMNTLLFLTAHFALHRGQMSYIVRLVRKT
jgi:uncharacterized damage-inducible protein DinB